MYNDFRFVLEDFEDICRQTSELFPKETLSEKFYTPFYVLKSKDGEKDRRINAKGPFHRAYLNVRDWLKYFGILVHNKPIKVNSTDARKSTKSFFK